MNLKPNWQLIIDLAVYKQLKKLPEKDVRKILIIIEQLAINPYGGDIQKIQGEAGVWRKRIGSYRIFYEICQAKKSILVFRMERRTSHTYR